MLDSSCVKDGSGKPAGNLFSYLQKMQSFCKIASWLKRTTMKSRGLVTNSLTPREKKSKI